MLVKEPQFALKSDGTTKVPYEPGKGFKLAAGTWYFDVSMAPAAKFTVHCTWDATLAASSLQWEGTNLPATKGDASNSDVDAGTDVSLVDTTAGNWITPNSGTTTISTGTGITVTGTSVAIAGTSANGTMMTFNEFSRRGRIGIVVTVAGYFRCHAHGKTPD